MIRNKGKLRTILIPDALAKKLRAYCRKRAITTGPLFVTRTGRTLDRSNVWKMLKRLADAANCKPHTVQNVVSPDTPMLCRAVLCFCEDASGPG